MKPSLPYHAFLCLLLLMIAMSCKETDPLVKEVKMNYKEAKNDSSVAHGAPDVLKEAHDQLKIINNLKKNGANKKLIHHYAYIAKQKITKAYDVAVLNATQDKIVQAENERRSVLSEVQKAKAAAALRRAEIAQQQAKEAQKRSQELAQKISEMQAEKTDRGIVLTLESVLFDFGKATLKPGSEESIARLSRFLVEYPKRTVMIEGFTDNIGSPEANRKLSIHRAEAVKQVLINHDIDKNRIQIRGYGEDFAVADNSTETGRQLNRRVEIIISDENGVISERFSH